MRKLYKVMFGILLLPVFLLSGCTKNGADKPAGTNPEPEASTEPSVVRITFEGTDLDGNPVSSDIFAQSKLTMVNVWATYCGPCLNEMPYLGELAVEYSTEEFQIIGIVSDVLEGKDQTLAESLVQQTEASYTHLLLNESIYNALLSDVDVVPTTFFLNQDGAIVDTVIGAKKKLAWEETINELLAKQ